jgi:hypothetical protein
LPTSQEGDATDSPQHSSWHAGHCPFACEPQAFATLSTTAKWCRKEQMQDKHKCVCIAPLCAKTRHGAHQLRRVVPREAALVEEVANAAAAHGRAARALQDACQAKALAGRPAAQMA